MSSQSPTDLLHDRHQNSCTPQKESTSQSQSTLDFDGHRSGRSYHHTLDSNVSGHEERNHMVSNSTKLQSRQQLVSQTGNSALIAHDNQIDLSDKDTNSNFTNSLSDHINPLYKSHIANLQSNNSEHINLSLIRTRNQQQRQVRFKSLLAPSSVISESDENKIVTLNTEESVNFTDRFVDNHKSSKDRYEKTSIGNQTKFPGNNYQIDTLSTTCIPTVAEEKIDHNERLATTNFFDESDSQEFELYNRSYDSNVNNSLGYSQSASPSHPKLKTLRHQQRTYFGRVVTKLKFVTTGLTNKIIGGSSDQTSSSQIPYYNCEDDDIIESTSVDSDPSNRKKFKTTSATSLAQGKRHNHFSTSKSFRGSYRYSRIGIVMALLKRLFTFLFQKSTLALFGAFLIHVTLGTVYTLSNVNSYLTSYMRLHGSPNATYGGSMWISSTYAVGQGLSMVLGGYIEKRFSARLACILGCLLHSLSIMSTSYSVNHGQIAVLITYGFLPGFGCGLAYMTPMSNGFGWYPHRKGLVAGVILAGFGIGTFVFNMAQTAYVNPENLSPLPEAKGYFTQPAVLDNVPHLFVFLGTIYATMQFIGCCLLFKPPSPGDTIVGQSTKGEYLDERPLLNDVDDNHRDHVVATNLSQLPFMSAIKTREFFVLFAVFGISNQGVLFVNSMLKEYAQIFIDDDMYLAWTGSMASIANSSGRLVWGLAIDRFSFTQCFTAITTIFGLLMFLMPFEFILSSKLLYLLCTLGLFGSFSGWMSTYPVHLSRLFGVKNSGMVYGLIFVSQSIGGIMTAFGAHYLIDHTSRFVPFFVVTFLEASSLAIYHLFYFR